MALLLSSPTWSSYAGDKDCRRSFATELHMDDGVIGLQWLMKRNCSVTPRQMLAFFASISLVSLGIATAFALHGAPYVLGFAALEMTVLGLALLVFARHAGDRETVILVGPALRVEQHSGARIACTEFAAEWLRVEPVAAQGSLLQLTGQGRSVRVGRFVRPEWRSVLAGELRRALRASAAGHESKHDLS